jgi:DNA gyrase subunit A
LPKGGFFVSLFEQRIPVNIEDEMKKSYTDYAMSVIIGRALPDVRDGLKPVHRRILYTMRELGLEWGKPYKKSARLVGDVMGKYHPHGDSAIYDTVVRMAQPFSLRYPLVDGQGNFGSVDGDPAAAMRYTESRMSKIAAELLRDIEKETVAWGPNYDDSLMEPLVLPARVPNLLINGSAGIAVGMATNIPPHNLTEICTAVIALIDNPEITIDELIRIVPGPDFPTGGYVIGTEGIHSAYKTGRGSVRMQARITTETQARTEKESIVVTEIPYMVNKARLIETIAALVREKKIEGIADLRDESDRDGMRIVIDLKRDAFGEVVVNNLYKHTQLQQNFGVIMLALVNNQPKVLNLKEMLHHFVEFRRDVVTRRCIFELKKAEARAHILEGLKIALDNLDAVITLIRNSKTPPEAKEALMAGFDLSAEQSQAILEMRLQRLTGLEREKINEEYLTLLKEIARFKEILANERLLMQEIVKELEEVRDAYGDARRTELIPDAGEISVEDLIVEEDMVVTISHKGYIKRNASSLYRSQRRGGKGLTGMTTREEDFVEKLFVASTHDHFLFFTDQGRAYAKKCYEIPQAGRATRGKAIVNLLDISRTGETIATTLPLTTFAPGWNIVMVTAQGTIKKTDLVAFSSVRSNGLIAVSIEKNDRLIAAELTDGHSEIFLCTRSGKSIRFKEDEVRKMGRSARGVRGIALAPGDEVVAMEVLKPGAAILSVTANGYGKRTTTDEYRIQGRGGQGIITIKTTDRNGPVIGAVQISDDEEVMLITDGGKIIRMKVSGVSKIGRNTQGVRMIDVANGDKLVAVAKLAEQDD